MEDIYDIRKEEKEDFIFSKIQKYFEKGFQSLYFFLKIFICFLFPYTHPPTSHDPLNNLPRSWFKDMNLGNGHLWII